MGDIKRNIVYLNITSYIGSIDAEHYYGSFNFDYKDHRKIEVVRTLSKKEADYLNKKDSWSGWEEGSETRRFNSVKQLEERAIEMFMKELHPEANILISGDAGTVEPQKVLVAPKEFIDEADKLYKGLLKFDNEYDRRLLPLEDPAWSDYSELSIGWQKLIYNE